MNISHSLKTSTLVSVTAAATALLIQACGGGAVAQTADGTDPYVGVWSALVTVKDCTSAAALATFKSRLEVHQGGTLGTAGSPTSSNGFGTWQRQADGSYTSTLVFDSYNADGTLAGTQMAKSTRTLAADGNSFTSVNTRWTLNPQGTVVSQGCATETGTRITW